MVRKALLGALVIVALFAAPAAAQYPTFQVNPGSVRPGGQANFNGRGCQPGETVTITVNGVVVATTTANPNGNFNGRFTVNLPSGNYTVTATCGSVVQTAPLLVRSATAGNSGGTGNSALPRTGSNLDTMGLVGAGLLAAGGAVVLATRKRQAA